MNDAETEVLHSTAANEDIDLYLDYSIKTPAARVAQVEKIIANTPSYKLTPYYLEKMSNYILGDQKVKDEEGNKKDFITNNRMATVTDRETSFEGLVGKLENGEDGIYNMIANDKNIIFKPHIEITEEDRAEIPPLRELYNAILTIEEQAKHARGRRAYLLHQTLKQMRQDQYVIKGAFKKPIYSMNLIKSISKIDFSENIWIDPDGDIHSTGLLNFFNKDHVSALLRNYSKLKEDSWDKLTSDTKWMMEDLDELIERALPDRYPIYYDMVICKIDGKTNAEIQEFIEDKYNIRHSVEYISSLWRNKIPKLIAEEACRQWLEWHFTYEAEGKWKQCGRCKEIKLAHPLFFSRNSTSKDGYYSICKVCRNKK